MKIISFSGNLGNQIFYCAFKDYLKRNNPNAKVYKYIMIASPPVTVEKYFNLTPPDSNRFVNFISFVVFYMEIVLNKFLSIKLSKRFVCSKGPIYEDAIFFSNYLQDKYFYEKLDSSWLKIKMPDYLTKEYLEFEELIKYNNSICVHIRRGDYIKPESAYVDLSATDYYQKAIAQAKSIYPKGKIFLFSDDLDFARKHFKGDDYYYVDCNRDANSYLDIKLMSLGKVNIMANSTFSYWGAYIGHENKEVYYPSAWFRKETGRIAPDIMLNSWNKIEI